MFIYYQAKVQIAPYNHQRTGSPVNLLWHFKSDLSVQVTLKQIPNCKYLKLTITTINTMMNVMWYVCANCNVNKQVLTSLVRLVLKLH